MKVINVIAEEYAETLSDMRSTLERLKGRYDLLAEQKEKQHAFAVNCSNELNNTLKAILVSQEVAKLTQQEIEVHVCEPVSAALASIFDDPYKLVLDFVDRRGRTEIDILFERRGMRIDPFSASGGGVVDVAAFALRIVLWHLQKPKSRNTLILDEPFKFLSTDLQPKASRMLKELSDKLNIQVIMVSHEEDLVEAADKSFRVSYRKGKSVVEESMYKEE